MTLADYNEALLLVAGHASRKTPSRKRPSTTIWRRGRQSQALQWFQKYPAERELSRGLKQGPEAVLVVDVGGGRGHEISKFHRQFPNLTGKLIVQDRPETITSFNPNLDNIIFMSHDFFTEQSVKGEPYFLLSPRRTATN